MSKESNSSGGVGIFGLLGLTFVILKLTHVIDWSWWWVTSPFWGGFALIAIMGIVLFFIALKTKL
jgi:hypothetical protein